MSSEKASPRKPFDVEGFTTPWRIANPFVSQMHVQHCKPEELKTWNSKLYALIMKYGCAFDDYWYYWITKKGTWMKRTLVFLPKHIRVGKPLRFYQVNKKLEKWIKHE
jgi:hypothetical protein